jgi:hypothetical protein
MERVKELDSWCYFPGGSSKSKLYKSRKRKYFISIHWGGREWCNISYTFFRIAKQHPFLLDKMEI